MTMMTELAMFKGKFMNSWKWVVVFVGVATGVIQTGKAGTIHVFVRNAESQPVEGALVGVLDNFTWERSDSDPHYTDASGHFVFSNLVAGVYIVSAFSVDVPYQPRSNIQIGEASETNVVIMPTSFSLYNLSGRVLERQGKIPVSDAVLSLVGATVPIHDIQEVMNGFRTSSDGCFRYHVYPGDYSLSIDTSEDNGMVGFVMDEDGMISQLYSTSAYDLELTTEVTGSVPNAAKLRLLSGSGCGAGFPCIPAAAPSAPDTVLPASSPHAAVRASPSSGTAAAQSRQPSRQ